MQPRVVDVSSSSKEEAGGKNCGVADAADGADVQSALGEITKRSTVPQVFIGGKFVGGCDGKHRSRRMH